MGRRKKPMNLEMDKDYYCREVENLWQSKGYHSAGLTKRTKDALDASCGCDDIIHRTRIVLEKCDKCGAQEELFFHPIAQRRLCSNLGILGSSHKGKEPGCYQLLTNQLTDVVENFLKEHND